MSKFSEYFKKIDRAAREAFREFDRADDDFNKAKRRYDAIQQPSGGMIPGEYAAQAARAKADLLDAEQSRKRAQGCIAAKYAEIRELRKKLIAELEEEFSAKPSDVDGATLELLKSGILSGCEYNRLMRQAADGGNYTMARVVGFYAAQHATRIEAKPEIERSESDKRNIRLMRACELEAQDRSTGAQYLEAFDAMAETLNRCANNPDIRGHWEELTASTVEGF